jgi:hypothetical protein
MFPTRCFEEGSPQVAVSMELRLLGIDETDIFPIAIDDTVVYEDKRIPDFF